MASAGSHKMTAPDARRNYKEKVSSSYYCRLMAVAASGMDKGLKGRVTYLIREFQDVVVIRLIAWKVVPDGFRH